MMPTNLIQALPGFDEVVITRQDHDFTRPPGRYELWYT